MTSEPDTVRVYTWADAGPYLGGISEDTEGRTHVTAGGFGDNNLVFEIPRELWERYTRAADEMLTAQDEIEDAERKAQAEHRAAS